MANVNIYGKRPYLVGLLHGGPGATGEMQPVAMRLSRETGVLEFLQTQKSIAGQLSELRDQIESYADHPLILVGYSWGAWLGFLFAALYPEKVKKLILISAGPFVSRYAYNLNEERLKRLEGSNRGEAERILSETDTGAIDQNLLKRLGELMNIADSYDLAEDQNFPEPYLDVEVYNSVWQEAKKMRDNNDLIKHSEKIKCPVVAFHGDYDPHPADGVAKPLSQHLNNFKMVIIEKCGHTPWKERQSSSAFFELLNRALRANPGVDIRL